MEKRNSHLLFKICGYHVNYEEFYKSLKQRGHIHNSIMNLWTCQFNVDEKIARAKDSSIMKKYSFLAAVSEKLYVEPEKFIPNSCSRILTRLKSLGIFAKWTCCFSLLHGTSTGYLFALICFSSK